MEGDTITEIVLVTPVLTFPQVLHSAKPGVVTSIAVAGLVDGTAKTSRRFGLDL